MNIQGPARDKWGQTLDHSSGFQIVPNLLLAEQNRLGLSSTDLVVLLHLNRYWWTRDQNPFPSSAWIATQMGLRVRSVERHLKRLEEEKLIQRQAPRWISGKMVQPISLIPLAQSLEQIAKGLDLRRQKHQSGEGERVQSDDSPSSNTANGTSSNEVPF